MIFQHTHALILAGVKTQTLRLAKPGDALDTCGCWPRVVDASGRTRWRVGGTHAVQPGRCAKGVARIRVTSLAEVVTSDAIDQAFVRREGFGEASHFWRIWRDMHGAGPMPRAWAIAFEVTALGRCRPPMPRLVCELKKSEGLNV